MLFSCVLRKLLCFNTATKLSEDSQMDVRDSLEENVEGDKGNNPGLVARLMGLETIVTTRKDTAISSSSGTRSLNCSLSSGDVRESIEGKHLPSQFFSLEHEEDFIVISFEDKRERNNEVLFRSKAGRRSRRKGLNGNAKQRKPGIHTRNDLQNLDPNKVEESMGDHESCLETIREGTIQESNGVFCPTLNSKVSTERGMLLSSNSVDCDEILNRRKQVKAIYSTKVEEQHCDIENFSPVSVLDVELYTDPRVAKAGSLIVGSLNSRRKLSTELGNYEELLPSQPVIDLEKRNITSNAESRQDDLSSDNFSGMIGEICKMAQEDVTKLHWDYTLLSKVEDIKDISAEFELQIIGGLLDDLVDQLIDIPYD